MKLKVVVHQAEEGGYWAESTRYPRMRDARGIL